MDAGDTRPVEAAGGIEEGIPPVAEPLMVSGDGAPERPSAGTPERQREHRGRRGRNGPVVYR